MHVIFQQIVNLFEYWLIRLQCIEDTLDVFAEDGTPRPFRMINFETEET